MNLCMQKSFASSGKHAKFQQGHKGRKAKGHKAIKAGCKKFPNYILEHFRHLYVDCSHFWGILYPLSLKQCELPTVHLWSVHICYFPQIGYTWLDFLFLLLLLRIPLLRNLKNICIVMTNFMHAVIAIFLLKQSDPSIHFIFIVNTCNIKAENLVPFLPWAT